MDIEIKDCTFGYHQRQIVKGVYGEISKIVEEVHELEDAAAQKCRIMELNELSDLVGAVEGYLEKHHSGYSLQDLISLKDRTKAAFKSGHRK